LLLPPISEVESENKRLKERANKLIKNYNKLKDKCTKIEFELKQSKTKKFKNPIENEKNEEIFMKCLGDVRRDIMKRKSSSN